MNPSPPSQMDMPTGSGLDDPSALAHRLIIHGLSAGAAARQARTVLREALKTAGVGDEEIGDAELVVGELAANADVHACPPYELRIVNVAGRPVWCEVVDGDPRLDRITEIFDELRRSSGSACMADQSDELPQESGRGLSIVHRICNGRCLVFPTLSCTTGAPAKAVAFALPMRGEGR